MRVRSSHEGLDEMSLSGNLQTHFNEAGKELPKAYKIQFPIQMLMYSDQSLGDREREREI